MAATKLFLFGVPDHICDQQKGNASDKWSNCVRASQCV